MHEWSLTDLYPSYESEAYQRDIEQLKAVQESLTQLPLQDTIAGLTAIFDGLEQRTQLLQRLFAFIELQLSVNTADTESNNQSNVVNKLYTQFAKRQSALWRFLGTCQTDISTDARLSQYQYLMAELRDNVQHMLSDDAEAIVAKMDLTGGSAWGDLQSYLTASVEGTFHGKTVTLSEIRNLAFDAEASVRREAYETELAMYDTIKEPIAFALNSIKGQVNEVAALRGFDSPLAQTLQASRMTQQTLDALWAAVRQALPSFQKYLQHKAKLLGHQNGLPFYDLFAPIGKLSTRFSVAQSREYLVEHFAKFSSDLAEMTAEFYDKNYMDFMPRKGKVGGAFCYNLPVIKQSRILLNFDGSLSNVVTIAHELGHAYHGKHIEQHAPLNWDYSMPVAETASTFNENLIMNTLIAEASDQAEKIALIESQLQDITQLVVDIYSRFLFETAVFEKRQSEFLFAPQLEEEMLAAQREAYGAGLDPRYLHPYMWVNKGHYYSSNLSFYNFPYAFGGLFARGLYAQYEAQPEGFVERYQKLLRTTTVASVEDAAAVMGVAVDTQAFWDQALAGVQERIDQFIALTPIS